jgi:hypothetical protein
MRGLNLLWHTGGVMGYATYQPERPGWVVELWHRPRHGRSIEAPIYWHGPDDAYSASSLGPYAAVFHDEQSASYELGYWYATDTADGQTQSLVSSVASSDGLYTATKMCTSLAKPPYYNATGSVVHDVNHDEFVEGCESAF